MGAGSSLSVNETNGLLDAARTDVKTSKLDTLIAQNLEVTTSSKFIEQVQELRDQAVVEAIRKDRLQDLIILLKTGKVSPNLQLSSLKFTLLHLAVYYGSVESLRLLVKYPGTDVNLQTTEGDTPLMLAILSSESDLQALKLVHLLSQDKHIEVARKNGKSNFPLVAAVKRGFEFSAKILVAKRFIPSYSLDDVTVVAKIALRFNSDTLLDLICSSINEQMRKGLIQTLGQKSQQQADLVSSLERLIISERKGSSVLLDKWAEDAGDNKLRIGNQVQTLSKEAIKRFLPPGSKDGDIAKLAGQRAIIHNIIEEALYLELVDANCMAAINSKAVVFANSGESALLADESLAAVGSFVQVMDSKERLEAALGEGKWRHGMEETCGKTGRLVRFSKDDSVQVQFSWGCRFYYPAKALVSSSDDKIESQDGSGNWFKVGSAIFIEPNPTKLKAINDEIGLPTDPKLAGKLVQVDRISIKPFSTQKIVRVLLNGKDASINGHALTVVIQELDSGGHRVGVGDSVKLRPDAPKTLSALQNPIHGGYSDRILLAQNIVGVVEDIVANGKYAPDTATLKVRFPSGAVFHLNPKAVVLGEKRGKAVSTKGQLEVIKRSQLRCTEKLGEGGFGSVYKGAWTMENGKVKHVAVKQVNNGVTSANVFEDILKEAKTQFALRHPNIISIYGISYGPQQDLWIIMKLVEGKDLNSILFPGKGEKKFELPFKYKVKICLDVAYAIAFVHDKGYLHQDIKPQNMMVNMRTGRVFVCDFGITRYLGNMDLHSYATNFTDNFGGTLLYVAPECLKQDKEGRYVRPTFKSDVWSLGASFYEIFTEKYLFDDGMLCFKCKMSNDSEYVQKLVNFYVPQEVKGIIKKMVDFIPSRRPNVYELTDLLHSLEK